ncbi:hypothetical protein HYR69_10035 [Candidatus Sumerlaeota bacterium]|nr:hypothetical protein [Candidatus Sumerlaeota bacterium]MBI3735232.1 hypothetical protein [Candidatus Sumerlaeota bacterium]
MKSDEPLSRSLAGAVGLIAAAMLLVEILITRVFSVLFFYHYSSFAISLVMSGLTFGGLIAARWNIRDMEEEDFFSRLAALALAFSLLVIFGFIFIIAYPPMKVFARPEMKTVVFLAAMFLPGLTAAGAFLASAFARRDSWIGPLYASDLAAASAACVFSIFLMRTVSGPATLLAPALLAAAACLILRPERPGLRMAAYVTAALALAGMGLNVRSHGEFLRLRVADKPALERWNEHSRITLFPRISPEGRKNFFLNIDKSATTKIWNLPPREAGTPPPVEAWWDQGITNIGYHTGRPAEDVAIIGVGGGVDILAALARGAKRIDGYELNQVILDILSRKDILAFNGVAAYPEVNLIHNEARVGIKHSGKKYDLIQASMIDTWAATASGGFVLSENGLYTVEGWRTFLSALKDKGILTLTRWYLPRMPVEAERMVSLAAGALEREGIADPAAHVILVSGSPEKNSGDARDPAKAINGTIILSKTPFQPEEIEKVKRRAAEEGMDLICAPDLPSGDPVIRGLLDPATRRVTILQSRFDLSPTTDMRPYFFLFLTPFRALSLKGEEFAAVLEVTLNGTRIMMLMTLMSLIFAAAVATYSMLTPPSARPNPPQRALYRRMGIYFLGIGFGYILVQLGMHQRLILILGHPTLALSVVLFSMLLGTGLGSAASKPLFGGGNFWTAWIAILALVGALIPAMPALGFMENIDSFAGRAVATAVLMGTAGFVLGFAFPLGVRLVSPAGEWTVQKMWAINGAATIAGSSLASIIGVAFGSRAVIGAGLICYAAAASAGFMAKRVQLDRSDEKIEEDRSDDLHRERLRLS